MSISRIFSAFFLQSFLHSLVVVVVVVIVVVVVVVVVILYPYVFFCTETTHSRVF